MILALTLQQPWASAVADLGKDVENRTWAPPANVIGTRIAIHAGRVFDEAGAAYAVQRGLMKRDWMGGLPLGAVVAAVHVAGATTYVSTSRWAATGLVQWLLEDVRRLREPVRARGAQGLWRLDEQLEDLVLDLEAPAAPARRT